ncbi:MAG: RtcB family protein [Actinobacteria bacterium]|nr:MAG: RtcB family protein [Actinomycetota bacterium]
MLARSNGTELRRLDETQWEIPRQGRMRVPARVFADEELLDAIRVDQSLEQLANVATLPGIVEASLAMPDVHQGYGFPVGGVAATEPPAGVISPGGVGYDINCGVRLLALPLTAAELGARTERLVAALSREIPTGRRGSGASAVPSLGEQELDAVLSEGPRALVARRGIGTEADVERTESRGMLEGADPSAVSQRARERGRDQLGTMGSGNHFVELQRVEDIFDSRAAAGFGLVPEQVTALIHSGSRGLGHQVCSDFVKRMDAKLAGYGIDLPDRQLSCAPIDSADGRAYLAAMAAAANFAWANRHAIAHGVRTAIGGVLGAEVAAGTAQLYDVAHNIAKLETHAGRVLCVHRKGATRAFPGQPVFIPGSMGTASYVLAGTDGAMERSFGTVCHGAGRRLSRAAARRLITGAELRKQLEARGVVVRCPSNRGLAEEAPLAYKEVDRVVEVVERAGLAVRVARLRPIGVVKG